VYFRAAGRRPNPQPGLPRYERRALKGAPALNSQEQTPTRREQAETTEELQNLKIPVSSATSCKTVTPSK